MRLTRRLATIADCVIPGTVVADIGTDHARLPIYLIQSGRNPKVIATELNKKPYEYSHLWVASYGLKDKIEVRQGNGLKALAPGEAQVIVIAGMGGNTIRQILAASPEILRRVKRLVLQPMVDAGDLRLWLVENGWCLIDEILVQEDKHLYVVLVAEPGEETTRDRFLIEIGPRLTEKSDPLLLLYLQKLKEEYQQVLSKLARSRSQAAQEKAIRLTDKLSKVREIINNVSKL